ncbi:hypothetical protein [Paenibacillus azoreducens]|uniref:hypothetical protein n=1 Tax=Paenibacillus azoreducens TaxID=116718 RepID=UPI001BB43BA7|nr:hypothetical protein [Paenibacillus azoreducens]
MENKWDWTGKSSALNAIAYIRKNNFVIVENPVMARLPGFGQPGSQALRKYCEPDQKMLLAFQNGPRLS